MTKNHRCLHVNGKFWMRRGDVLAGIEECAMKWVVKGETYDNLSQEEAIAARNAKAQARQLHEKVLSSAEVGGCRFMPPETSYCAPWGEIEQMHVPMMVKTCRWPRNVAA